jgi:hypothetical protein
VDASDLQRFAAQQAAQGNLQPADMITDPPAAADDGSAAENVDVGADTDADEDSVVITDDESSEAKPEAAHGNPAKAPRSGRTPLPREPGKLPKWLEARALNAPENGGATIARTSGYITDRAPIKRTTDPAATGPPREIALPSGKVPALRR